VLNPTLRDELLEMRAADLRLRDELVRDGSLFDGYNERMAELHRRHNARLALVLAEHGWPGRSLVGEDGAAAAWLLLQHAILDPSLMRQAVPLLERAVHSNDADPRHVAFLVDRIRTMEGRPQLYGTSHDWDEEGNLSPLPIDDPATVDERRRQVGLEPLTENTRRLRAQAEAEGEEPPADYQTRRREADAWARATGWRSGEVD
jgi:hypothetical protein